MTNTRVVPVFKTIIFTALVPGSVVVLVPHWIVATLSATAGGWLRVFAIVLVLVGASVYLACAWDFAYHGLGTPAPIDPPRQLISRGLNRFVRNPMYLGVLAIVLGQAALFLSPSLLIYAACLAVAFHLFVVFYEEPALHRKFGEDYDAYRRRVPRWIPRL